MFNANEFIEKYLKEEKERIEMLMEQAKKGCKNCSQWDDYLGCDKCAR